MNMRKAKEMAGEQFMIDNEALEGLEEYMYLGQRVSANPAHEKEMGKKMVKYGGIANSSLPLSFKRRVNNPCVSSLY